MPWGAGTTSGCLRRGPATAAGTEPEGDYDDPTAVLAGVWGRNQHARARVFSRNQTEDYFQEVEIRLRSAISPHSCTGYEVFWRCLRKRPCPGGNAGAR